MPFDDLSAAEQSLVSAIAQGETADLDGGQVRAKVLQSAIIKACCEEGGGTIRVRRAVINGVLDLEGANVSRPVILTACVIQGEKQRGSLVLRDARVRRLALQSCELDGPVVADRAEVENGIFIGGGRIIGSLKIRGARIGGALAIEGGRIGDGTQALVSNGIAVGGPLLLRNAKCDGAISIARSNLAGGLYAENILCSGDEPLSINADGSRITGDLQLDAAMLGGGVCLSHAQVSGRMSASEAHLKGAGLMLDGALIQKGLILDGAKIGGVVMLDGAEVGKTVSARGVEVEGEGVSISARIGRFGGDVDCAGARLIGEVTLLGTHIAGQLQLKDAKLYGGETAIRADGLNAKGGCFLTRATISGLVRCPASYFGHQFSLSGATLKVEAGLALLASGTTFERDVLLDQSFNTIGAIVLDQVKVRGTVDLRGSNLKSAALARYLPQARGGHPATEIVLEGDPALIAFDEAVLSLVDAQLGRLRFPEQAVQRPRGIVDLSRAHVGSFEDWSATWPPVRNRAVSPSGRDLDHIVLDGFTYDHLTNPAGRAAQSVEGREERVAAARMAWLEGQDAADLKDYFKPGPWVQLAERLRAQGFDDAAREIAIGQRRRARRSAAETTGRRWQSRILDWFALYGFSPWRTVIWMIAVIGVFAMVWSWAGGLCAAQGCADETVLIITGRDGYTETGFGRGYPDFHPLAYSIDVFAPFVTFGFEDHWRFNMRYGPLFEMTLPSPVKMIEVLTGGRPDSLLMTVRVTIGSLLYVLVVLERLLGLILTSLAVTGFTGLLRSRD